MKQQVQHIDIPFDELSVFKNTQQQKYQDILIQTLLLSTLGTVHECKNNYKASIFVTLKSIWLMKKQKIKAILPVKSIVSVVKSYKHPEIVLITRQDLDNIRITTTSEQRCWYIISTLSYIYTYAIHIKLPLVSIKHGTLEYFQRSAEDKSKNRNVNMDTYTKELISYQKPFKDTANIFGNFSQRAKIKLQKQLEILSSEPNSSHLVYLARIKDQNKKGQSQYEEEDRYICHYIDKQHRYLQIIYDHKNVNFITQLMYAKCTDFKIQLFFQFSRSLRGIKIIPAIFKKIWKIYDLCKQVDNNFVLSTDSLLLVQRTGILGQKIRRQGDMSDYEQKLSWANGQSQIVVRQFRYQFLSQAVQLDRFLYYEQFDSQDQQLKQNSSTQQQSTIKKQHKQQKQKSPNNKQNYHKKYGGKYFKQKLHTIGLIIYQLSTGRSLLSFTPAFINQIQVVQEQIQTLVHLKRLIKKQKIPIFPRFLDLGIDDLLKNFIQLCIFRQFVSQEELFLHPWVAGSKIKIL